jgi:Smr domain/Domain of unknown function (DUF2027)
MLRAKEEGVVTRFLDGDQVEIEIEDGFRIPVMRSQVVPVSPMEAERVLRPRLGAEKPGPTIAAQRSVAVPVVANQGVYLAFVPQNDREVIPYLINNTDWDLPFALGEEQDGTFRGLQSGLLRPKSHLKLNDTYTMAGFDTWPTLVIQMLWFRRGAVALRPPAVKRLKCRADSFYKARTTVPTLDKAGHLYQLDQDDAAPVPVVPVRPAPKVITPAELKAEMLKPKTPPDAPTVRVERPSAVVDLHTEVLLPNGTGQHSPGDLLALQLDTFERSLENAIATGMSEITFIHGLGSGSLRQEVHRRLGKHPQVKFFEDAQKQKFGYGATKVTLR